MDFIGTDEGPAPLLRDVDLVEEGVDPIDVLEEILSELYLMFNNTQMVPGDFSEHNIVWFNNQAWIIDVLQSERWHPKYDTPEKVRKRDASPVLFRDVEAILEFFKKKYQKTFDYNDVIREMIEEKVDD